ncbi:DUF6193 family natural product biosynthesis protein [Kitasatospora sp. NPDC096147]|uniref:DUF6193 family natural product biosynthesis protein n=1 Tax=Kitasatospora sp. NPDC096147 TaxID=3364093 RepID=UPI0038033430
MAGWLGGAGLAETEIAAPFIRYSPWALVHEREPLDPVELAWQHGLDLRRRPVRRTFPHELALWEAAHARPELRCLVPSTSHRMLRFRAADEEHSRLVGGGVDPLPDGSYQVRGLELPDPAPTTDPAEAIAVVVASVLRAEDRSVSEKHGDGSAS